MASIKRFLAICLALILALTFSAVGWAGGPTNYTGGSTAPDGDGHPWDDGTVENSAPATDSTGQTTTTGGPTPLVVLPAMFNGASPWVHDVMFLLWWKATGTAVSYGVRNEAGRKQIPTRRK